MSHPLDMTGLCGLHPARFFWPNFSVPLGSVFLLLKQEMVFRVQSLDSFIVNSSARQKD